MKFQWILVCILGVLVTVAYAQNQTEDTNDSQSSAKSAQGETELKTNTDKVSYGIGLNIGRSLKQQGLELNSKYLAQGLSDALAGKEPRINPQELQAAMQKFQQEMAAKQSEQQKADADKNKKEGEAFLAANKEKEGVKTLPSGLQYKVIRPGTGEKPKETDLVKTKYTGTLPDGTEFDSSGDQPVTFPVNEVIDGWTEALQLMKVGAKWQLFVPAELAYGERGAGEKIGPNQVLIFEIELLDIEEKKEK